VRPSIEPKIATAQLFGVLHTMADLDSYSKQLDNFRASDDARERLVSVRFFSRVQCLCNAANSAVGDH